MEKSPRSRAEMISAAASSNKGKTISRALRALLIQRLSFFRVPRMAVATA